MAVCSQEKQESAPETKPVSTLVLDSALHAGAINVSCVTAQSAVHPAAAPRADYYAGKSSGVAGLRSGSLLSALGSWPF